MKHIVEFTTDETEEDFIECLQESLYDHYCMSGEFKVVTTIIDYNDGAWHPVPKVRPETVHEESTVEMVWLTEGGARRDTRPAGGFIWADSKVVEGVAFRVKEVHVPLHTIWVNVYKGGVTYHDTRIEADTAAIAGRLRCAHMREVRA